MENNDFLKTVASRLQYARIAGFNFLAFANLQKQEQELLAYKSLSCKQVDLLAKTQEKIGKMKKEYGQPVAVGSVSLYPVCDPMIAYDRKVEALQDKMAGVEIVDLVSLFAYNDGDNSLFDIQVEEREVVRQAIFSIACQELLEGQEGLYLAIVQGQPVRKQETKRQEIKDDTSFISLRSVSLSKRYETGQFKAYQKSFIGQVNGEDVRDDEEYRDEREEVEELQALLEKYKGRKKILLMKIKENGSSDFYKKKSKELYEMTRKAYEQKKILEEIIYQDMNNI